ncbi:hypothetical protein JXB12_05355 [candidate division KSB1 bacterium]|nr:hypothetical protein [candidate division KSB1 bacterium]
MVHRYDTNRITRSNRAIVLLKKTGDATRMLALLRTGKPDAPGLMTSIPVLGHVVVTR